MNQETQTKFAAILAAAQVKTASKTVTNFNSLPIPEIKPVEVKQPEPLTEVSNYTFDSLLSELQPENKEPEPITLPEPIKAINKPEIVDYSDISFAIVFPEKPNEQTLDICRKYGKYNKYLKCGKGWIFSKKKYYSVKNALSL
jgi:hypothetical protein